MDEFILYYPEDREKIRALYARQAGNNPLSGDAYNVAIGASSLLAPAPAFPLPAAMPIYAPVPPVAPSSISTSEKPLVPAQDSAPNFGHPDQAFKFSVRRIYPTQ